MSLWSFESAVRRYDTGGVMVNTRKPVRSILLGILLAFLIVPKAIAGLIEYALILQLIAIIAISALDAQTPAGFQTVANQLQITVEGARAANIAGDRAAELSRLGKAIGTSDALVGMIASCANCDSLRGTVQQIIGQLTALRVAAGGGSATCHPNAVIQPNEQCDPLAIPTGCPTNATLPLYCSDECTCQVAPIP
jgi:Flp pilus assembly pilin Flp